MLAREQYTRIGEDKIERVRSLGRKVRSDFRRLMEMEDFLDSLEVIFHSVNEDGVVLWASQYELNVFGYTKEQFVGKPLADFILDPEALKKVRAPENQNGSSRPLLVDVKCGDGSLRRMYLQVNWRLTDSPKDGLAGIGNTYGVSGSKPSSVSTS